MTSAAYVRKVARIAERRCRTLGVAGIARALGTKQNRGAAADAYADTWPTAVREAAHGACVRGLSER